VSKESLGIIVQYKVKVKLILGALAGWVLLAFTQNVVVGATAFCFCHISSHGFQHGRLLRFAVAGGFTGNCEMEVVSGVAWRELSLRSLILTPVLPVSVTLLYYYRVMSRTG